MIKHKKAPQLSIQRISQGADKQLPHKKLTDTVGKHHFFPYVYVQECFFRIKYVPYVNRQVTDKHITTIDFQ